MKKQLIAVAGLAVLSAPAYASKARMSALGQDTDGSWYIKDQRYVFTNPAYFNKYNNFVITEWGDDNTSTASAGSNTANAEGGFARQSGNFVYSVYLGRDNEITPYAANTTLGDADQSGFLEENNRLELSLAGDAGVQWGATLWYSSAEDQLTNGTDYTREADSMGLRGGVIFGDISAAVELDFGREHTGSTNEDGDKLEIDFGWSLDLVYNWGDWAFKADASATESSETDDNSGANDKIDREGMSWSIGAGNTKKLNDKATMYWDLKYANATNERKVTTETEEVSTWSLPITVGLEAQANSWLTLRGSVKQNIFDSTEDKNLEADTKTYEDKGTGATTVAAGASLTYGKLMVDGTISTSDGTYDLGTDTLTEIAVHYWF